MIRPNWIWGVVSLIALTAGCRMCGSPYDYNGPVLDGTCQAGCNGPRAGSILSGAPAMPQMAEPMPEPAPEAETQPQIESNFQPQPAPSYGSAGSASQYSDVARQLGIDPKTIISVTDRKVEDTADAAPQEAPQVADESAEPADEGPAGQPKFRSVKTEP